MNRDRPHSSARHMMMSQKHLHHQLWCQAQHDEHSSFRSQTSVTATLPIPGFVWRRPWLYIYNTLQHTNSLIAHYLDTNATVLLMFKCHTYVFKLCCSTTALNHRYTLAEQVTAVFQAATGGSPAHLTFKSVTMVGNTAAHKTQL